MESEYLLGITNGDIALHTIDQNRATALALAQQASRYIQIATPDMDSLLYIPPTPRHAVPVRKHNAGLQSLGGDLKQNGYKPLYVYGGYSYFDNMKGFFSANGYEVIDRTDVDDADVHHETVWGIADEDILRHSIKVISAEAAAGRKVFAHIMTTSNHRPYTYPDGRIDIPSGSGGDGAVKYTDWAIGDFMRQASQQPWFSDTVFVFVADHTSHGRGRTELPPQNYRIPLIIYSPSGWWPRSWSRLRRAAPAPRTAR